MNDAEIPAMCGHAPSQLTDGEDLAIADGEGYFQLEPILDDGALGIVEGLPFIGGELTVVVAACSNRSPNWPHQILAFDPDARVYATTDLTEADWSAVSAEGPDAHGVTSLRVDGDELVLRVKAVAAGTEDDPTRSNADPVPTTDAVVRLRVVDHHFEVADVSPA